MDFFFFFFIKPRFLQDLHGRGINCQAGVTKLKQVGAGFEINQQVWLGLAGAGAPVDL